MLALLAHKTIFGLLRSSPRDHWRWFLLFCGPPFPFTPPPMVFRANVPHALSTSLFSNALELFHFGEHHFVTTRYNALAIQDGGASRLSLSSKGGRGSEEAGSKCLRHALAITPVPLTYNALGLECEEDGLVKVL